MLLSYKWMDGIGLGSLCGAIIRASLRDANNVGMDVFLKIYQILNGNQAVAIASISSTP